MTDNDRRRPARDVVGQAPRRYGVWVHAVTRGVDRNQLDGLTGVGGGPVRLIGPASLAAVVSTVDLTEFGEEPLRHNLEDLDWLESVARSHHQVANAVAQLGPVVPTRLATVHLDDAGVAAELTERGVDLTAALDRVDGRVEWGIKAYARPVPTGSAEPDGADADSPGRAYLRRRRNQLTAADRSQRAAKEGAAQLHSAAGQLAEAARRHPPQDRQLSGTSDSMVLNGAYLVATDRVEEFTAAVRRLAEERPALRVELTGPWPPYSFAAIVEPEAAE